MIDDAMIFFEKSSNGWAASVPSIPGVYAFGKTKREVQKLIYEAIPLHVAPLIEHVHGISIRSDIASEHLFMHNNLTSNPYKHSFISIRQQPIIESSSQAMPYTSVA